MKIKYFLRFDRKKTIFTLEIKSTQNHSLKTKNMSTSALVMMLVTEISIILVTGYFFYKVLTMPAKIEE